MDKKKKLHDWRQAALECARAAEDKKADSIVILDIRGISTIADYFLICDGTSDRHIRAISEEIRLRVKEKGLRCVHLDGYKEGQWVVLDFAGVIAHIFHKEAREYYKLEALWGDAVRVDSTTGKAVDSVP